MARKPRIEFAGAVYHVISRGELMGENIEGKVRESYLRDELQDHDEGQALKMLKRWLKVLGMQESDLPVKAKGAL